MLLFTNVVVWTAMFALFPRPLLAQFDLRLAKYYLERAHHFDSLASEDLQSSFEAISPYSNTEQYQVDCLRSFSANAGVAELDLVQYFVVMSNYEKAWEHYDRRKWLLGTLRTLLDDNGKPSKFVDEHTAMAKHHESSVLEQRVIYPELGWERDKIAESHHDAQFMYNAPLAESTVFAETSHTATQIENAQRARHRLIREKERSFGKILKADEIQALLASPLRPQPTALSNRYC